MAHKGEEGFVVLEKCGVFDADAIVTLHLVLSHSIRPTCAALANHSRRLDQFTLTARHIAHVRGDLLFYFRPPKSYVTCLRGRVK